MSTSTGLTTAAIQQRIRELQPWFHNLELAGVRTAPDHFLGDYPAVKWRRFAGALPSDLRGASVLDIGCNAGFHAVEMKRRGAGRVLGIDADERYLEQARLVAEVHGVELELRRMSVYDIGALHEQFDYVLCLGVLYHLRYPLLALDLIRTHVARDWLVVQTLQRGAAEAGPVAPDYDFFDATPFERPDWPRLQFIEHRYAGDPTNWWFPNRACTEAMLRSAGFEIVSHPEAEVYVCRCSAASPAALEWNGAAEETCR